MNRIHYVDEAYKLDSLGSRSGLYRGQLHN